MASRRGHYGHGAADTMGPHKRASLRGFGGLAAMLSTGNDVPGASPNSPTPSASTSVSSLPSGMMVSILLFMSPFFPLSDMY
jgi:hypothetical protein